MEDQVNELAGQIPQGEVEGTWRADPPKKPHWLPTNELRWKGTKVAQLTSKINAPRSDRILEQKWICHKDDEMKEEWREVPVV